MSQQSYGPYGAAQEPGRQDAPFFGEPPMHGSAHGELAGWWSRVGAFLLDYVAGALPYWVLASAGGAVGGGTGVLLVLLGVAWFLGFSIWNWVRQGRTGQTIGKRALGLRLISERDGQPVGAGTSIGRGFLHILDGLPFYLGFLWPIWDDKKQTFADKIVSSVVVKG